MSVPGGSIRTQRNETKKSEERLKARRLAPHVSRERSLATKTGDNVALDTPRNIGPKGCFKGAGERDSAGLYTKAGGRPRQHAARAARRVDSHIR
jgi:hypothetical protein